MPFSPFSRRPTSRSCCHTRGSGGGQEGVRRRRSRPSAGGPPRAPARCRNVTFASSWLPSTLRRTDRLPPDERVSCLPPVPR
eukprot:509044-Prorocentrum_minimum.AAC.1